MSSPFPGVAVLARALRRRSKLLVTTAVAGVLCAVLFFLVLPVPYAATASILLKHSNPSERALQNDAELLKTRTVAQRAIRNARLGITPEELRSRVTLSSLSDEILQLRVEAPTRRDAARRAGALLDAFLSFRAEELERQAGVVTETLQERLDAITRELGTVNDQITAFSAPGRSEGEAAARTLGDLLTRRATLSDRHQQLRQQIDRAFLDANTVVRQSRVLDAPTLEPRSPFKALVINSAAGLVAGLALGAGWVAVQALTSERLWRRADVAAALGAPVAVGIGGYGASRLTPLRPLGRRLLDRKAWPEVAPVVRQFRRTLARRDKSYSDLVVVSQGSDRPTATALVATALQEVEDGNNVLLADLSAGSVLRLLLGVTGNDLALVATAANGAKLWLAPPQPGEGQSPWRPSVGELPERIAVVVAMATADPTVGLSHLSWATSVVAVVTAGRSTDAELRATAAIVAAAGLELSYVVLVGADRDEQTLALPNMRDDPHRQTTGAP